MQLDGPASNDLKYELSRAAAGDVLTGVLRVRLCALSPTSVDNIVLVRTRTRFIRREEQNELRDLRRIQLAL